MKYFFVGSSHMRYMFNAIVELYLGELTMRGIPRRHGDINYLNIYYKRFLYIRDLPITIRSLCEKHSKSNITVVIQSGAWDLNVVDAYSITAPRLGFSEDNEVTCLLHYICRLEGNEGDEVLIVQTPSGNAVMQSVVNALSVFHLNNNNDK
eukprot:gene18257-23932_t